MIDIENEVFTLVHDALKGKWPEIYVTGSYNEIPSSLPAVYITEMDNAVFAKTLTQNNEELHARVVYEVNAYSNAESGKKTQCKEIIAEVDRVLCQLGFTRISLLRTPNMADANVYRMTGRYRAVIRKDRVIYRG